MGNQQLLFITLGVIIVALAISVGVEYFQSEAVERNRDAVILDLNRLANLAQIYYAKPSEQNGGGGSFVDFEIPTKLDTTTNGTYQIIYARQARALIQGTGIEEGDSPLGCSSTSVKITYQITVTPTDATVNQVY